MPSSMIFASLVVLWLLILVPAVARHRQEVARPSVAALSGRVLERPRKRTGPGPGGEREVDAMDEVGTAESRPRADERDDAPAWADREHDEGRWERPPPRYRPGRGGFDPEAAAAAARAKYAFRQRVVLVMLLTAVVSGVVAGVALPQLWWLHAAVDAMLVGYLVYLRRQVRLEEAIRARRAARMAGTRRPSAADDPELDEWARRGRELTRRAPDAVDDVDHVDDRDEPDDLDDLESDHRWDDTDEESGHAAGEPVHRQKGDPAEAESALPRLRPAPPPPLPAGTSLVEVDEEDPELYDLDRPARRDYRRAAGE